MSQDIFDSIDPAISGTDLAGVLNDFKAAIMSGLSGPTRPTELEPGGYWVDTANDPTTWSFKLWTGSDDVEVFKIDLATGGAAVSLAVDNFTIRKVSADSVGAVMELVKRRVASGGQVNSGDVVGEIRMVGRTDTGTNPVVAKIVYTAGENQTSTAFGGTLSFYATPAGTATLTEHMKFVGGIIESIVPHKINAQTLVGQEVASTATITALNTDKTVVEITGSTATEIRGIDAAGSTKVITIVNRMAASNVTLKNDSGGATASDRISAQADIILGPKETATLYYSVAASRWIPFGGGVRPDSVVTVDLGYSQTWVAPITGSVRLSAVRVPKPRPQWAARSTPYNSLGAFCIDRYGKFYRWGVPAVSVGNTPLLGVPTERFVDTRTLISNSSNTGFALTDSGDIYSWGMNDLGQTGTGTTTTVSSPVIVLGGVKFKSLPKYPGTSEGAPESFTTPSAIGNDNRMYTWGANSNGQLGLGDTNPRSSPVVVLGNLDVRHGYMLGSQGYIITTSDQLYGWGLNSSYQLGLGDNVNRSSPTLILSGISRVCGTGTVFQGTDGKFYSWGSNTNGELGLGDTTPRSSPVVVFSGFNFRPETLNQGVGITEDGTLYGWGSNSSGQLGQGDTIPRSSPVAILAGVASVVGSTSRYALAEDGTLYAWGANSNGQLGLGDTTPRSSPVAVLGGSIKFSKVFAANSLSTIFAVATTGVTYSWGSNANGVLGLGDTTPRSSPTVVLGGIEFEYLFPYSTNLGTTVNSVLGVDTSGRLYSWGSNHNGALGLGDTIPRSSPVAVLGSIYTDTKVTEQEVFIPVTSGQSYAVVVGGGLSTIFGSVNLGVSAERLRLSYYRE